MSYKIEEIEGIGPSFGAKLQAGGVTTTDDLLDQAGTPKGRKELAAQTGLNEKQLLDWANMADLMRIKGIGKQYAELLEAAGVDTVKELRNRRADNLAVKIAEINESKKLARTTPAETQVEEWVQQAKALAPKISY